MCGKGGSRWTHDINNFLSTKMQVNWQNSESFLVGCYKSDILLYDEYDGQYKNLTLWLPKMYDIFLYILIVTSPWSADLDRPSIERVNNCKITQGLMVRSHVKKSWFTQQHSNWNNIR